MKLFSMLVLGLLAVAQVASSATGQWQSIVTSNALEVKILEPAITQTNAALPVVIYLKNLAAPRIGTESDEAIIKDLRADGQLVVTIDYAKNPRACVPFINRDLGKLRDDLRAKKILTQYKLDDAHIFIVPEGCRLKRDILYDSDTNRPLAMDIIYPSQPKQPVGALLEFSCENVNRMG